MQPPCWALQRVPGLEGGAAPRRLERLPGSTVNEVFRVDSPHGAFVLRLNGPAWRRPGVDRRRELALHARAAHAGIAPAIVDADPEREGLLILPYLEGRQWSDGDFADPGALRRLGERLQRLHALPAPDVDAFDPWAIAQSYLDRIGPARCAALPTQPLRRLREACEVCEAAVGAGTASSIVHGDLWCGNLLEGDSLWLLDWEYAQRSAGAMDVACVLAYYPVAQPHARDLAAAAGLAVEERSLLPERTFIYRALSWLWHCARGEAVGPP